VKTLQGSLEGTRMLQRPGVGPVSMEAAQAYRDGQITQRLAAAAQAHRRLQVWAVLGGALLLLTGALAGYFAHQISLYSAVSITSPQPPPRSAASDPVGAAPASPLAGVAVTEDDPMHRQVVTALKWLGRKSLEDARLTAPPEDNAYYYFTRLLELEPGSVPAREGLAEIGRRYALMAESEIRHGNYALAESYLLEGLRVDPTNKQIQVLRSSVQIRERSFIDTLLALLRGEG
jgi:serine/threonine-protein kinase PpkA